jgi:hypothetical protein
MNHGIVCREGDRIGSRLRSLEMADGQFALPRRPPRGCPGYPGGRNRTAAQCSPQSACAVSPVA